ncbi:TVP38/TMEM64 family protein [Deferribacter thermophilus]|uniref:TVP38/TMEM64 family protein n=1 Tax=Deferribacter thermophilus TaxID=53573 RepID=UPI003C1DDA6A
MKKYVKAIVAIIIILTLIYAGKKLGLSGKVGEFREWIASKGSLGPLIFIFVYAAATVMAIPGSALTILAGAMFGSFIGIITVIIGATLGASICFLLSRYLARDLISNIFQKNEKFKKLDDLTEKHGAIIVAITRLVPIFPFNLLNYGFGLTKIPFKVYVLWSFLCMLPGTVLYVVGVDAIVTAITKGEIPWVLIFIILVVFVILFFVVKKARKRLKDEQV